MSGKLRVGIAGLGRIFDLNCRSYIGHDDAEVVGLCDTDPALLQPRAALFPGARTTTDYREMLSWDFDLVDILTPYPVHADMTEAALAAGALWLFGDVRDGFARIEETATPEGRRAIEMAHR